MKEFPSVSPDEQGVEVDGDETVGEKKVGEVHPEDEATGAYLKAYAEAIADVDDPVYLAFYGRY